MGLTFLRSWLAVVTVAAAMVSGLAFAEEACPASCDTKCSTCCKSWTTRAGCSDGKAVMLEGAFASYTDAVQTATRSNERLNSCSGPGPNCREWFVCSGGERAVWTAYCVPDQVTVSPAVAAAVSAQLTPFVTLAEAQIQAIDDTMKRLDAFLGRTDLTSRGRTTGTALATQLEAKRPKLAAALDGASEMLARQRVTEAEAKKLRAANARLVDDVARAVASSRSLLDDARAIDTGAEERARKKAEAEAAAQARKAAAEEAAQARKAAAAEAAQARKAAAAEAAQAREAAAAARREAAERQRAEAAAKRASEEQARTDAIVAACDGATARLEAAAHAADGSIVTLDGFLRRPDVQGAAAAKGRAIFEELKQLQLTTATTLQKIRSTKAGAPTAAALASAKTNAAESEKLASRVDAACSVAKEIFATQPTAPPPPAPSPAPPPDRPSDMPTCSILFEPQGSASGVSLSVDGGKSVSLPTRVDVVSGRHVLTVKRGKASREQIELILCGRISSISVAPPP